MTVFILTIGRCMFLGIFSSAMRKSLYKSGLELKEAYKRIEELAELDELTGSFNRRCIMRMLDDEIARAHRINAPCSIALIDLDWFKRINDAYGHPTGDEVLRTFAITVFANIRSDRPVRPLRRRGIPAGASRYARRRRGAHARPAARDHCRSRLERVLAGHAGDDFRRRRDAEDQMKPPTPFSRAPTARSTQPRRKDATASPAPDPTTSVSGGRRNRRRSACRILQDRVMSSKSAATSESLLDELQTTLAHGTVARRVETLRRVTDLFINGAVDYSDDQIGLFDDVFQCLMHHIETSAKALLVQSSGPDRPRAAADHSRAGVRRSDRGRSSRAVQVGTARRRDADRDRAQQEPGASDGDFDPQGAERRGHRRAGAARQ